MNGCLEIVHANPACYDLCMKTRSLNHSTYQHQYHVVWNTKYRFKFLKPYVKQVLLDSLYETAPVTSLEIYRHGQHRRRSCALPTGDRAERFGRFGRRTS